MKIRSSRNSISFAAETSVDRRDLTDFVLGGKPSEPRHQQDLFIGDPDATVRELAPLVAITSRQSATIVRLLGDFQGQLESLIESHTVDGEVRPKNAFDEAVVRKARRQWRQAKDIVAALSEGARG